MTPADPDAAAHYVAERLLLTVREDVGRADVKASVLLSGAVAVPALVLGRGTPGVSGPAAVFLAAGAVLWAAGTLLLLAVIVPRTRTLRSAPGPTFYADALAADTEALRGAAAAAGADRVGWLLTQFQDVSVILSAKYRWLRGSMALLGAGLLLAAVPLALG
ncbi:MULTISPECIES: Pycsar system effector family protein [unclassified Streptomyces]|uniref:Pycsar system effector family protein n=1 Tax=unclassified Streptomyces TaxID=2593676 RepID=UPI003448BA5D